MQAVQPHVQQYADHGAITFPATRAKGLVVLDDRMTVPPSILDRVEKRAIACSVSQHQNAIEMITDILGQHPSITCLYLFARQQENRFWLGSLVLDADTIEQYSWELQAWFSHAYSQVMLKRPQIHVYCGLECNGAFKLAVLNPLSLLTGAEVIAV